jgi:hypothetical protein
VRITVERGLGIAGMRVASRQLRSALVAIAILIGFLQIGVSHSQAAACASGSLDGSFASGSVSDSIGTAGEVDCYTLNGVTAGDQISVGFLTSGVAGASPGWTVVDGNDNVICGFYRSGSCTISGAVGWSLRIRDTYPETGTFSYTVVTRRLTKPQGCSPALGDPPAWSFASPRLDGSVSGALGASCYTFTRTPGEADGNYWFRSIRSAGAFNPLWRVYGPSGSVECEGSSEGVEHRCQLLAFGQFALVVTDSGESQSGSFFVTSKRLSSPGGCAASPSVAFGASPASGSISSAGEADCYSLASLTSGDAVSVGLAAGAGSSGSPRWSLVDGEGNRLCDAYSGSSPTSSCQLSGASGWSLLVYDASGGGTFSYSLSVRRLTTPQGCSPLGDPAVWSFTAPRIDGAIGGALDSRCYTFSRSAGEADGNYWFRTVRTSGTLSPRWAVYGPSGSNECEGGENTQDIHCRLLASGQYTFAILDSSGEKTGSFFATAKRLTSPLGCSPVPSLQFGDAPAGGTLSSSGRIDCYSIPGVSATDTLSVGLVTSGGSNPSPRWTLIDADGNSICDSYNSGSISSCPLSGAEGWSLLVYDAGSGSYPYSLAVRRLTNPQGCSSLGDPAVWSFTAPRLDGSVSGALDARCYTFKRPLGEPDGSYWLRAMRSSGTLGPEWQVYGPNGQRECRGYAAEPENPCTLLAAGQFSLVVSDSGGTQSGTFLLGAKRLNAPSGCASLPDIASGIGSTLGNLSTAGEADCYVLPATEGDQFHFEVNGAADRYAVIASDGSIVCRYYYSSCGVTNDGPYSLLVFGSGTSSGNYHLKAQCENPPCGQTETAVATATPNKLGQSQFTTVLLRGHDLDLLDEVTLSRGGQQLKGEIQEPSKDARAVDVRFNLAGAAAGSWSLAGHFVDGSVRTLAGGLTVEAAREGNPSVETVGRGAFRAGSAAPFSVVVHNPGNVDQIAVPVVLRGLPSGATLTPLFDSYEPSGSPGAVSLNKLQYNQASESVTENGEIIAPFLIARVPAGRSVSMDFTVTIPGVALYKLNAMVGRCLGPKAASGSTAVSRSVASSESNAEGVNCAGSTAKVAAGVLLDAAPLGSCIGVASDLVIDAAVDAGGGEGFWSWSHAIGWLADGAWCAGEIIAPESKVLKVTLDLASGASSGIGGVGALADCLFFANQAALSLQGFTSVDPNDLEGPAGVGAQHFIQAGAPLTYKVLFENIASATAAAESIKIRNHLDGQTLEPASVLFAGVRFGHTRYMLPYPSPTLDETFDLRPQVNAQVHVTASVSGEELRADLVAVDPDTLKTPEDPAVGVLPPNQQPPEGEGELLYTVSPQPLPSGEVISNSASIQFDQNDPITTPTWSNVVDKQAPTPSIAAEAEPQPLVAHVSWGGSDDAAGITLWRLEVSKDGAPFELWRTATSADAASYEAPEDGAYSFRVVAYDGAGNVGQSSLAGVNLAASNSLTVVRAGTGSGTVTSGPGGIHCGSTCAFSFARGSEIILTASADPGSTFAGWSGGGCSGTGSCTVGLFADTSVTARFDPEAAGVVSRPAGPAASSRPVGSAGGYANCASAARDAFQRASKAAKRKHGKARANAIKAARKKQQKATSQCRTRFPE